MNTHTAFKCIIFLFVSLCSSEDLTSEPMKHNYSEYINPVLVTYVWKEFFLFLNYYFFLSNQSVKLSKHLINQLMVLFIKEKHLSWVHWFILEFLELGELRHKACRKFEVILVYRVKTLPRETKPTKNGNWDKKRCIKISYLVFKSFKQHNFWSHYTLYIIIVETFQLRLHWETYFKTCAIIS